MPDQTSQTIIEGANNTVGETTRLTLEKAIEVTQDPWFFVPLIGLALLTIVIYLIWGAVAGARTTSGTKIPGTSAIQTGNFWISFTILFVILTILIILTIFPFWLKFT